MLNCFTCKNVIYSFALYCLEVIQFKRVPNIADPLSSTETNKITSKNKNKSLKKHEMYCTFSTNTSVLYLFYSSLSVSVY